MTEEIREQQLQRAREAQQLLDSKLFQEACADIEERLAYVRRSIAITAPAEVHTRVILMDQLWGQLKGYFEQMAQTGKLAHLQVVEEERRRKTMMERILSFRTTGRNSL